MWLMSSLTQCPLLLVLINICGLLPQAYSSHADPAALYHHSWPPRLILNPSLHYLVQSCHVWPRGTHRPEALSPANTQEPWGARETLIRYIATRPGWIVESVTCLCKEKIARTIQAWGKWHRCPIIPGDQRMLKSANINRLRDTSFSYHTGLTDSFMSYKSDLREFQKVVRIFAIKLPKNIFFKYSDFKCHSVVNM